MSGLLFLTAEDFRLEKSTKSGLAMVTNIPGFSLILFYSTACTHCQQIIPLMKKMPGSISGCQFGMINVSTNKAVVRMSKESISPITYVPLLILYINSRPYMKYNGSYTIDEIRRFVIEVANKIQTKQKFSKENVREDPKGKSIPSYAFGIPLCGDGPDGVCYLTMDEFMTDK